MMTTKEYFMGRDQTYASELTDDLRASATLTVQRVNTLLTYYMEDTGSPYPGVRSGWRPPEVNAKVPGAAPKSKHMVCQACDVNDNLSKLKSWCMQNLDILEEVGLWMESPESTALWCHLQTVAPGSGHRVFIP